LGRADLERAVQQDLIIALTEALNLFRASQSVQYTLKLMVLGMLIKELLGAIQLHSPKQLQKSAKMAGRVDIPDPRAGEARTQAVAESLSHSQATAPSPLYTSDDLSHSAERTVKRGYQKTTRIDVHPSEGFRDPLGGEGLSLSQQGEGLHTHPRSQPSLHPREETPCTKLREAVGQASVRADHMVSSLRASIETQNRPWFQAASQSVDDRALAFIAIAKPQHGDTALIHAALYSSSKRRAPPLDVER